MLRFLQQQPVETVTAEVERPKVSVILESSGVKARFLNQFELVSKTMILCYGNAFTICLILFISITVLT